LGYTTHAHFVLEERMAESPEKCAILSLIYYKTKPAAQKSLQIYRLSKKLTDRTTRKMGWWLLF
jgi:peptidyl-dipeptidase Dcp